MRNKILSINDKQGNRFDSPEDINKEAFRFYECLLGTQNTTMPPDLSELENLNGSDEGQ